MQTIKIINVHCEQRKKELERAFRLKGFENVEINIEKKEISFQGDEFLAKEILAEPACILPEKSAAFKEKLKYFFKNKCLIIKFFKKLFKK